MTFQEIEVINKKAKTRKDGVYSFNGNIWLASKGNFVAFANHIGECYQRFGSFNVQIGKVKESYDRKKALIDWAKKQSIFP